MIQKLRNTFFILALSLSMAFAQTVPDFTITDIDGVEYSLYADYLDQGKTVVIDLFFVNCPPCHELAPKLEEVYQDWGAGQYDVQFIGLTGDPYGVDNDIKVKIFEIQTGITYPSASNQGGGPEAASPYINSQFGTFEGYPTIVVIAPDRTIQFEVILGDMPEAASLLNTAINNTGATHPSEITNVENPIAIFDELTVYPNPARDFVSVNFNLNENAEVDIQVFNMLGQSALHAFRGNKYPGYHQVDFDPSALPPGTYLIRITANDSVQTTRLVKVHSQP